METVFAMTVHKSQGSEFEHTALVLPDAEQPACSRANWSTPASRAPGAGSPWWAAPGHIGPVLNEAIGRRVLRASGLMAG
ncbi:MAG: ATP-binding domain-containing protein [Pseudorhodoferax sp.]